MGVGVKLVNELKNEMRGKKVEGNEEVKGIDFEWKESVKRKKYSRYKMKKQKLKVSIIGKDFASSCFIYTVNKGFVNDVRELSNLIHF